MGGIGGKSKVNVKELVKLYKEAPTTNEYSDVDKKYTPMNDIDREQVGGKDWGTRYFQTANAFDINETLRDINNSEGEARKEMENRFNLSANAITVAAMDRNMLPTNKDMKVARMAGTDFLNSLMEQAGIPSSDARRILGSIGRFGSGPSKADLQLLNNYLTGGDFSDGAFMSTTYNLSLDDAAFESRPIKMNIDVPKGTRGMFSPTGKESEFVLARDTSKLIKQIRWNDKARKLEFDMDAMN